MLSWLTSAGYRLKFPLATGLIIIILQIFLWTNADLIYGSFAEPVRDVMLIYLVMYAVVWAPLKHSPLTFTAGRESFWNFVFIFIGTSAFLLLITVLPGITGLIAATSGQVVAAASVAGLGFGALHAFVKAYIEESVFRDALPRIGGLGDIWSSVLFGLFHFSILITFSGLAVLEAVMPMIILMALGYFWSKMRNGFGIMGATASHFAWNLFAMGVIGFVFTGGIV